MPIKPGQIEHFKNVAGDQVQIEREVKRIIESNGVRPMFNHFYMNFGKKLVSLISKFKDAILLTEMEILQTKWIARGLDANVLNLIKQYYVPSYSIAGPFTLDVSLLDGLDYLV